jgi:hypothetical protein
MDLKAINAKEIRYDHGMACAGKPFVVCSILLSMIAVPLDDDLIKSSDPAIPEIAYAWTATQSPTLTRLSNQLLSTVDQGKILPGPADGEQAYKGEDNDDIAIQTVSVFGRVQSEFGEILASEKIRFHSTELRALYSTFSNAYGEFVLNEILPGDDYVVTVSPNKLYKRYTKTLVDLNQIQNNFDIILESIPLGLLAGTVLNAYKQPVANLPLQLRTLEKDFWSARVTTDANGAFVVPQFPKGRFEVSSEGNKFFRATGFNFDPNSGDTVNLTIDHGPYVLGGRIFNEAGQAFDGATVVVVRTDQNNEIRIRSSRHVTTDPTGKFRFYGLGPGIHELIVSVWNGNASEKTVKKTVNLGIDSGELDILIEAL